MNGMVVEEALRNAILERDLSMLKRILRTHGKQVTAIDMVRWINLGSCLS